MKWHLFVVTSASYVKCCLLHYCIGDPFNLSNIVAGNVSNQTFGKKNGAGNLANFSYTFSVNLSKKREAIKLAIWQKIDLAGKVLKKCDNFGKHVFK